MKIKQYHNEGVIAFDLEEAKPKREPSLEKKIGNKELLELIEPYLGHTKPVPCEAPESLAKLVEQKITLKD